MAQMGEALLVKNDDRRSHDRIERSFKLRYSVLDDLSKRSTEQTGELLDIGGGGVRFVVGELLRKNTQLLIVMDIPAQVISGSEGGE